MEPFSKASMIEDLAEFTGKDLNYIKTLIPHEEFNGTGLASERVKQSWVAANPQTDEEISNWYKTTDAYLFELGHYNTSNYFMSNMMLLSNLIWGYCLHKPKVILEMGGGIGTFTLALIKKDYEVIYYEYESRTRDFAMFRFMKHLSPEELKRITILTSDGTPDSLKILPNYEGYDAVIVLDVLEHVLDVEGYLRKIYEVLNKGGVILAQNAFGIGSPSQGDSIPMHLDRNNRFEKDYDPYLFSLGFKQMRDWTYRKEGVN